MSCTEHRWTPDYDRCTKDLQVYRCEGCGLWAKRNFRDGTFIVLKESPQINTYWENWARGVVDLDADIFEVDEEMTEGPLIPLDFGEDE